MFPVAELTPEINHYAGQYIAARSDCTDPVWQDRQLRIALSGDASNKWYRIGNRLVGLFGSKLCLHYAYCLLEERPS